MGGAPARRARQLATSNTLVRGHYASVLTLGDTQYEDGAYEKFVASYDPSWGRVKSITKPAPGNHEYESSGATGYYRYFGRAAGDPRKGYYSFDVGRWHLIALNSNCSAVGGLWRRLAPGAVAAARPRGPSGGMHARLLAPPAVLVRVARERLDVQGVLASVVRRGRGRRPQRARPRLRAFRRADAEWRSRSPSWPPPVRRRLGRQGDAAVLDGPAQTARHEMRPVSACSADARRGRVRVAVPPVRGRVHGQRVHAVPLTVSAGRERP